MLIDLPIGWVLVINIIAWFLIHMGISMFMLKVPDDYYERDNGWYDSFNWERNGQIWQRLLNIQSWKRFLPDSSSILPNAYSKNNLRTIDMATIQKFIIETKRGEHTHWLSMLPAPLFFIWNPAWAGWLMIAYAFIANIPFIITQRYNRPRLRRLYKILSKKNKHQSTY